MITVQELLADPPKLHVPLEASRSNGSAPTELVNLWKLSDEELLFINRHVGKSSRTLETGAGCSTGSPKRAAPSWDRTWLQLTMQCAPLGR